MFNIDASVLRNQAKTIRNTNFYLSVSLRDDAAPALQQKLIKTVHSVNGFEFEAVEKAKWHSKVFAKPVQQFDAVLEVYDNGLVAYGLYNTSGNKETCTAKTISNIFQIGVTDCFVTGTNGNDETKFNGVLTSVMVGLNRRRNA